jgi:hypothetical protein
MIYLVNFSVGRLPFHKMHPGIWEQMFFYAQPLNMASGNEETVYRGDMQNIDAKSGLVIPPFLTAA